MLKTSRPELSVIIVSWNVKEYLSDCLISIINACQDLSYETIVVDNASQDQTSALIKTKFPQVKLIANKQNLGLSKGNNQGIKISKGKYLLFLNPDTLVNEKAIRTMLSFLKEHQEAGMVGPEQLDDEKGKIIFNMSRWSCRGIFEFFVERFLYLLTRKFSIIFSRPYQTRFLNGGCWLARQVVFNKIGLFNESLFLYGEELDFCGRIRKAGWQIWFLRNCQIIHFREKSIGQTNRKTRFFIESYLKIIKQRFHKKT